MPCKRGHRSNHACEGVAQIASQGGRSAHHSQVDTAITNQDLHEKQSKLSLLLAVPATLRGYHEHNSARQMRILLFKRATHSRVHWSITKYLHQYLKWAVELAHKPGPLCCYLASLSPLSVPSGRQMPCSDCLSCRSKIPLLPANLSLNDICSSIVLIHVMLKSSNQSSSKNLPWNSVVHLVYVILTYSV